MAILFLEMKETAQAIKIARRILEMPIKVPSDDVDRIRRKANELINNE